MTDDTDLGTWLDAGATQLGITVAPEWRETVLLHLRITSDMAQRIMDFALPDDADAAPVFRA